MGMDDKEIITFNWCPDCGIDMDKEGVEREKCIHCGEGYCVRCVKEHESMCVENARNDWTRGY
jgi:hypothetical protein